MEVTMIHFYPDLMNLYGSYANVSALRRYLERLGCTVKMETVIPCGSADFTHGDFFYMGAGTERTAKAVMEDFARFREDLKAAAADGAAMLLRNSRRNAGKPGLLGMCMVIRSCSRKLWSDL